jgi:hypothetical protein
MISTSEDVGSYWMDTNQIHLAAFNVHFYMVYKLAYIFVEKIQRWRYEYFQTSRLLPSTYLFILCTFVKEHVKLSNVKLSFSLATMLMSGTITFLLLVYFHCSKTTDKYFITSCTRSNTRHPSTSQRLLTNIDAVYLFIPIIHFVSCIRLHDLGNGLTCSSISSHHYITLAIHPWFDWFSNRFVLASEE